MRSHKTWKKSCLLLPLGGLLLVAGACGAPTEEPARDLNALLTSVEADPPQAAPTTAAPAPASSRYYATCDAARAAGGGLDRDDGVACE